MPSATHVFEPGLDASPSPLLESIIREHLERATHDLNMNTPGSSTPGSEDLLLNDMGEYLCRTAALWACLKDRLLKGPQLEQAALSAHERSRAGTGMSDLTEVTRIDVDITRLRKIRGMTLEFSHKVQSTWRPRDLVMNPPSDLQVASVSPFCDARLSSKSMSVSSDGGDRSFKARNLLPDSHVQLHADAGHRSDESDESEDKMFLEINMEALRQRGKGTYSCPKAYQCRKGGVDKEGGLIIFDRNSSFAQHCNKHRKPWRCDIPGCPNPPKKRRFARRDGLERHKATVKHYVVT